MDGINRKPMNDVIVPQNDLIKRPSLAPEGKPANASHGEGADRIEKNPFFEKVSKEQEGKGLTRNSGKRDLIIWGLVVVTLLVCGFFVANYFTRATIEIVPLSHQTHIDNVFSANKEDAGDGGLVFYYTKITEEKSRPVEATIEKKIQRKASGKVVIFNAYSKDSQRLIKNTRLESPDHKIFRINDSVVVPGAKISGGKVVEPGSVEAMAYADAPGEEYNIGLADFTIPGFKGDPRYSKFSARSKEDSPLAGGFAGVVKVPTEEAVAEARKGVREELTLAVVEKTRGQIPADSLFFPGSMALLFEDIPEDFEKGGVTSVGVRAIASVFFFDKEQFVKKMAEASLEKYAGDPFAISDMKKLAFSFVDSVEGVVLEDITRFRFRMLGDVSFVGVVDAEKVKTSFAGKNKKDFAGLIVAQKGIEKADAVIRPVWQTAFPLDPEKITVKIVSGE